MGWEKRPFFCVTVPKERCLSHNCCVRGREGEQASSAFPHTTVSNISDFQKALKSCKKFMEEKLLPDGVQTKHAFRQEIGSGSKCAHKGQGTQINHGICHLKWLHHSRSGFLLVYSQWYGVSSPSWSKVKTQGLSPGKHKFWGLWKQYLKKEKARNLWKQTPLIHLSPSIP